MRPPAVFSDFANARYTEKVAKIRETLDKESAALTMRYYYQTFPEYEGGRRYASLSGMQRVPGKMRPLLLRPPAASFADVDIVNSHPSLAANLCRKYGAECPVKLSSLDSYVAERKKWLEEICSSHIYIPEHVRFGTTVD